MRLTTSLIAATLALPMLAHASIITVAGNTSGVGNCYPFGCAPLANPYMGFVYKNLSAFSLNAGDTIAFDLGATNDRPLSFNIWLGSTTTNGGTTLAGAMTQVVTNGTGTGQGNTVIGDFDLVFTIGSDFNFAGGGLVVAFSPVGTTNGDTNTYEQNLVHSYASDSSGLFVGRFYNSNSIAANTNLSTQAGFDTGWIGHMRINPDVATGQVPEPGSFALAGLALLGLGLSRRRHAA